MADLQNVLEKAGRFSNFCQEIRPGTMSDGNGPLVIQGFRFQPRTGEVR
jgi:hypothetical protein